MTLQEAGDGRRRIGMRLAVWGGLGALMLLPPLAIELVDEAAGDPGDFIFGAVLLAAMGLAFEVAARMPDRRAYVAGLVLAVLTAGAQAWINLAVGVIGNEEDPANLMYFAVVGVAAGGALVARLRPLGLAYAMVAAAAAQIVTFVAALVLGLGFTGPITVFFTALWLISAWLFRRSVRTRT